MEYDAFISYSRTASGALAHSLHQQLQQLARDRSDGVFRDTAALTYKVCATWPERIQANIADWMSVLDAMAASRWLVLLASADAARSWAVNREVEYWLTVKTIDRIAIVAETAEPADGASNNVARECLPPVLRTRVEELPVVLAVERDLSRRSSRRKLQTAMQQLATAIYPEQLATSGRQSTPPTSVSWVDAELIDQRSSPAEAHERYLHLGLATWMVQEDRQRLRKSWRRPTSSRARG